MAVGQVDFDDMCAFVEGVGLWVWGWDGCLWQNFDGASMVFDWYWILSSLQDIAMLRVGMVAFV